jgi:hypothetical protein
MPIMSLWKDHPTAKMTRTLGSGRGDGFGFMFFLS